MPLHLGDNGANAVITLRMINTVISGYISPSSVPFMISQLYMTPVLETCALLPSSSQYKSEGSALLHRFKTRVSSLLQSKTPSEKWTGLAFAKAAMESSFECLASNGEVWVRLIVPILNKPEPPPTINYAIATLTRVFTVLTVDKPTLIRQIVSPNLPPTIGHILNILAPVNSSTSDATLSEDTLATGLEALNDLLCHNPVTFRPFIQRTQEIVLSLLSSQRGFNKVGRLTCNLFVSLHLSNTASRGGAGGIITNGGGGSAPGNKATAVAEGWTRTVQTIISETDELFNIILRCTNEEQHTGMSRQKNSTAEVSGVSNIGLSEWKGILEGFQRAEMLLRLLSRFLCQPTSSQVVIPLGQFLGLVGRLTSLTHRSAENNSAIERAERDTVTVALPGLLCCALDLLSSAIERLERLFAPLVNLVTEQLVSAFSGFSAYADVRTATYTLLTILLKLFGPALDRQIVSSLNTIIYSLNTDLVLDAQLSNNTRNSTPGQKPGKSGNKNAGKQQEVHADSLLSPASQLQPRPAWHQGLTTAGENLLIATLERLPPSYLRPQTRTSLDRISVCIMNQKAMMASVLFPAVTLSGNVNVRGGSLLPHLVGASKGSTAVEGIVRPRLPVVWVGRKKKPEDGDGEDEEDEEEEDEEAESEGAEEEVIVKDNTNIPQPDTIPEKWPAKRRVSSSKDQDTNTASPSSKRQKSHTPLLPAPIADLAPALAQESQATQVVSTEHTTLQFTTVQQTVPDAQPQLPTTATITTTTTTSSAPKPAPATITTTSTSTTQYAGDILENTLLEALDSDDEMIIPEIDMGDSSDDESEEI
ncbi:hypothetical protein L873DRAFT_1686207 [Choiromyces venosus 120613-1]|uniref:Pre-rRNA-processing protein RIX1 n=1 Tax=Choiromyces venosus 120613-1 TaxID=1336337 RepID=A0A3N4JL52_9PEZI|nr:hypothetical protein L873DRAFT_1686207 [Choiromyces venosus 120613-1]